MEFVELKEVSKVYSENEERQTIALKKINLTIKQGEFTVLSGPSGSGKSTLLNIIGALDHLSSGSLFIDKKEISSLDEKALSKERREDIGFVFQSYNLIPVLSAFENIEYVMTLQGVDKAQRKARVEEVANILGIEKLLDKKPTQMSGGQQQRVAVARAVASRPKLILADEPTANLDSGSAQNLMQLMKTLNEKEGITILFSSHDQLVIEKAKRLLVLKDGEIVDDKAF